ncbi:MAG: hypothetical protein K8W52_06945 [Deltaproteobacteria bacterium]|nr:hypothetical protein [Deltaproteobacteria bacterium]
MTSLRRLMGAIAIAAILMPHASLAQPAPAAPDASAASTAFLEQRVVQELAADGTVLSRLNVVLQLERVGTALLVSLVDPTTGRAVASTKIDQLPDDRDAAVATVTPVVANLVAQLAGRNPAADEDHARLLRIEKAQREQAARADAAAEAQLQAAHAEQQYEAQAIRFDREIAGVAVTRIPGSTLGVASVGYRWTASRGEVPLEGTAFYEAIGRPDLVRAYHRRGRIGVAALVVSGGLIVGSLVVATRSPTVAPDYSGCQPSDFFCRMSAESAADEQSRDKAKPYIAAATIMILGSGVGVGVGIWYLLRKHPVGEAEARRLGAEYNRKLRADLGLSAARSQARRSIAWAPYVTPTGAGLALGGSF